MLIKSSDQFSLYLQVEFVYLIYYIKKFIYNLINMLETILKTLANTPFWAYLIFGYLVYVGISATKTQVVHIFRVTILASLFFILSITRLKNFLDIDKLAPYIWLTSIFIGIIIGWTLGYSQKIRIDKENKLIELSGTWIIFIILMFIFFSKYALSYLSFTNPSITQNIKFIRISIITSSLPAGVLIGRVLYYFYRFQKGPYVSLKSS